MPQILLIPTKLDAFYSDGTVKLTAPLADFTGLPYYSGPTASQSETTGQETFENIPPPPPPPSGQGVNGNNTFLGDTVFRKPNPSYDGLSDTWTPAEGIHLHWSLPDALTVQRTDPNDGGKSKFPQLPNRWLVILSTQTGNDWAQQKTWVVESDYLYPDPKTDPLPCGATAISFPIATPDDFQNILESTLTPSLNNPSPGDLENYPFLFKAPFRCMGRNTDLASWQGDTNVNEYLSEYNSDGITAIGYGHPLFAAVYSNCFSVFGFHDDLTIPGYPRRYDVIGWYDEPGTDCLNFFQSFASDADSWNALQSEYDWTVASPDENFPTTSAYYSRLEINAALTGSLPLSKASVTLGNTATEALSAYLSQSVKLNFADPVLTEEQLEAITLQTKLNGENIDLAAKFMEARHDKSFKKTYGGSLWSVRSRSTKASATDPSPGQGGQVTLPSPLADMLNSLNSIQQSYDDSINEIDSLRKRAFADWFRYEYQFVSETGPGASLPSQGDIMTYSQNSALVPLQQRIAATGEISFITDSLGNTQVSVEDNGNQYDITVQYTLAQQLVNAINQMSAQLGGYNQGQAAIRAGIEYYLVRKQAPRFYQPADPAVLLQGDPITVNNRIGMDGTLNCTVCTLALTTSLTKDLRANGLNSGAFNAIISSIETIMQSPGQGYQNQSAQPWNPVSLEWSAQIWPEQYNSSSSLSGEGFEFDPDYLTATYEQDVDSTDLLLTKRPYGLIQAENALDYTGRAILVSHAPSSLQNAISAYLMPLTLWDIKTWGLRGNEISDEIDYSYDLALFTWANITFSIQNPTFLTTLKDPSTLSAAQLTEQKNEISAWMLQQYPFVSDIDSVKTLIDLVSFADNNPTWNSGRPVIDDSQALDTFGNLNSIEQNQDPLLTAINAYTAISGTEMLSQSLSGFNDALLTQQREFQLPVWDWRVVNLPTEKVFARDMAKNIGHMKTAPVFTGAFLPIRTGLMQLSALTLIDSFGQILPIDYGGATAVQKSERMTILDNIAPSVSSPSSIATPAENSSYIYLAPRLTQESQLNFRWLSASQGSASGIGDEQEMNDHPASTPVCGWVLPNNIDSSLAVYAGDGTALGSLVQSTDVGTFSVVWQSAPGTNNYTPLNQLPNPHLFDFVSNILTWASAGEEIWLQFLSDINLALQNIDPKSFAQNISLSLLIGRPMALVRATLSLKARGLPNVDQTVQAFNYNQSNNLFTRLTNGFDNVQVPVRLGEAGQLNDGLVAYWIEDGNGGYLSGTDGPAHFPEMETSGNPADAMPFSISGDASKVTMLIDPRGTVHASCGVLPVKEISLPPDQYADVLKTLSVTFLTSPLITPVDQIQVPIPSEPGYGWSWLDHPTGFTWNRVAEIKNVTSQAGSQKQRIIEGWLKLTPQTEKDIN